MWATHHEPNIAECKVLVSYRLHCAQHNTGSIRFSCRRLSLKLVITSTVQHASADQPRGREERVRNSLMRFRLSRSCAKNGEEFFPRIKLCADGSPPCRARSSSANSPTGSGTGCPCGCHSTRSSPKGTATRRPVVLLGCHVRTPQRVPLEDPPAKGEKDKPTDVKAT